MQGRQSRWRARTLSKIHSSGSIAKHTYLPCLEEVLLHRLLQPALVGPQFRLFERRTVVVKDSLALPRDAVDSDDPRVRRLPRILLKALGGLF